MRRRPRVCIHVPIEGDLKARIRATCKVFDIDIGVPREELLRSPSRRRGDPADAAGAGRCRVLRRRPQAAGRLNRQCRLRPVRYRRGHPPRRGGGSHPGRAHQRRDRSHYVHDLLARPETVSGRGLCSQRRLGQARTPARSRFRRARQDPRRDRIWAHRPGSYPPDAGFWDAYSLVRPVRQSAP